MPGGRPTKYTEELILKAPKYLEEWEELGDMIPSQAGLAVYLGISIACVENWGRQAEKVEFLRVLDKIEAQQRRILFNNGLTGVFNAAITKLVLTKHGFSDKQDQTHSGPDGGPIKTHAMSKEEIAEALAQKGIPMPSRDE